MIIKIQKQKLYEIVDNYSYYFFVHYKSFSNIAVPKNYRQ